MSQAWNDRNPETVRKKGPPFRAVIETAEEALGDGGKLSKQACDDALLGVLVRLREKCDVGQEFQDLFELLQKIGPDGLKVPPSFKLYCGFALMADVHNAEGVLFGTQRADGVMRW